MVRPKPKSRLEMQIHWREWQRRQHFPGLMKGRQITSEVHMMSMLNVKQRRARIKHHQAQNFRWRLRGQYIGPMLFER